MVKSMGIIWKTTCRFCIIDLLICCYLQRIFPLYILGVQICYVIFGTSSHFNFHTRTATFGALFLPVKFHYEVIQIWGFCQKGKKERRILVFCIADLVCQTLMGCKVTKERELRILLQPQCQFKIIFWYGSWL